jgi:hypothetical protein
VFAIAIRPSDGVASPVDSNRVLSSQRGSDEARLAAQRRPAARCGGRMSPARSRELSLEVGGRPCAGAGEISGSLTMAVDAGTESTRVALERLDLTGPSTRALLALDAGDRIALPPTRLESHAIGPSGPDGLAAQLTLGLIWRIDGASAGAQAAPGEFDAFRRPGHVKLRWTLDATSSERGSWLTIRTCFAPTDEAAAERLLDAWGVLGALSRVLAERAARAVRSYAEALENELAA